MPYPTRSRLFATLSWFLLLGCLPCSSVAQAFTQGEVSQALKEALQVAAERSTEQLGQKDGFFGNALVKILLPAEAQKAAEFLRRRGGKLGASLVDDVIEKMNRAAELAVAESETKALLVQAVKNLTLADALLLLKGDSTAATAYLQQQTEGALVARLQPIVAQDMEKVGLQDAWARFAKTYNNYARFSLSGTPVATLPEDISAHVTQRTLAGLFTVLGEKEREIRRDPVGQAEGLARQVFGSLLGGRR